MIPPRLVQAATEALGAFYDETPESHERDARIALAAAFAALPDLVELFRKALMEAHAHDWDMDTVSEAAHVCAAALAREFGEGT